MSDAASQARRMATRYCIDWVMDGSRPRTAAAAAAAAAAAE